MLDRIQSSELFTGLGWILLNSLWQVLIVGVVVLAVVQVLSRSQPRLAYVLACIGMLSLFAWPVKTMFEWQATVAKRQAPVVVGDFRPTPAIKWHGDELPRPDFFFAADAPATIPPAVPPRPIAPTGTEPPAAQSTEYQTWLPLIATAWLLGVCGLHLYHLGGWFWTLRLRRSQSPGIPQSVITRLKTLADRMGLSRTVNIAASLRVDSPVTIGAIRPIILMPPSLLSNLSVSELDAILAHELAHIRRHDFLVNLLQTVTETFLFFHPIVWVLSHQIRLLREYCCDDDAVELCGDTREYVRALATVEQNRQPGFALSFLGTRKPVTLRRIERLIRPRPAIGKTWLASIGSLGVLVIVVGSLIGAQPDDADSSSAGWGEPTDGVEVSLSGPTIAVPKGQIPVLHAAIRNKGTNNHAVVRAQQPQQIEMDGVWYDYQGPYSLKSSPLPPGSQYDGMRFTLIEAWRSKDKQKLPLTVGKHRVRVAIVIGRIGGPKGQPPVKAISQPIEFEISPPDNEDPDGWGPEVGGLRTRLVAGTGAFQAGYSVSVRLEVTNQSDTPKTFLRTRAALNDKFEIVDQDGHPAHYVASLVQQTGTRSVIEPGETVVIESFDLGRPYYLRKPGVYKARLRGGFLPTSGWFRFEIQECRDQAFDGDPVGRLLALSNDHRRLSASLGPTHFSSGSNWQPVTHRSFRFLVNRPTSKSDQENIWIRLSEEPAKPQQVNLDDSRPATHYVGVVGRWHAYLLATENALKHWPTAVSDILKALDETSETQSLGALSASEDQAIWARLVSQKTVSSDQPIPLAIQWIRADGAVADPVSVLAGGASHIDVTVKDASGKRIEPTSEAVADGEALYWASVYTSLDDNGRGTTTPLGTLDRDGCLHIAGRRWDLSLGKYQISATVNPAEVPYKAISKKKWAGVIELAPVEMEVVNPHDVQQRQMPHDPLEVLSARIRVDTAEMLRSVAPLIELPQYAPIGRIVDTALATHRFEGRPIVSYRIVYDRALDLKSAELSGYRAALIRTNRGERFLVYHHRDPGKWWTRFFRLQHDMRPLPPDPKVSIPDGVYFQKGGYSQTILELNQGRYRYWFFNDAVLRPPREYPLVGDARLEGNSVHLDNELILQQNRKWSLKRTDGLLQLVREKGSRAYGVLQHSPLSADEALATLHLQATLESQPEDAGSDEPPSCYLSVRNHGSDTWTFFPRQVVHEIEVDGLWYQYTGKIRVLGGKFPPGASHQRIPFTISGDIWHRRLSSGQLDALSLQPGKHTIRIAAFFEADDRKKRVRAVSNPITIQTTGAPAAAAQPNEQIKRFGDRRLSWHFKEDGRHVTIRSGTDDLLKTIADWDDTVALYVGESARGEGLGPLVEEDYHKVTDKGIKHLAGLKKLKKLDISDTGVTDEGLAHLAQLTDLRELWLDFRPITDKGVKHLRALKDLRVLRFHQAPITDEGFENLQEMLSLEDLQLGLAELTDLSMPAIGKMKQLKTLDLRVPITDEGLAHVSGLSELDWLCLGNTKITNAGLQHLSGLQKLTWLILNGTQIDDEGLRYIEPISSLESLYLRETKISDQSARSIAKLRKIQYLDLQDTAIGDETIERIVSLPELSFLRIDGTQITDRALELLEGVETLTHLEIRRTPSVSDRAIARLKQRRSKMMILADRPSDR